MTLPNRFELETFKVFATLYGFAPIQLETFKVFATLYGFAPETFKVLS